MEVGEQLELARRKRMEKNMGKAFYLISP